MADATGVVPALNPAEAVYFISLYFFNYFVLQLVSKVMALMNKPIPKKNSDAERTATFQEFFTLLFYILSVISLLFITLQAKGSSRPATFSGLVVALIAVPSSLGSVRSLQRSLLEVSGASRCFTLVTNYYIG
jgi:glucan phosphoethanolaminetransferase (alkaline phosphatase superfamily)